MSDVTLYGATAATLIGAVAATISAIVATRVARREVAQHRETLAHSDKHHSEEIKLTQYIHITQRVFDVGNIFIENPQLRQYFYDDVIVESTADIQKITSVAIYILDFYSTLQEHKVLLTEAGPSWDEWNRYIEDGFRRSPYLCFYFEQKMLWYEEGLRAMYRKIALGDRQDTIRKQRAALGN